MKPAVSVAAIALGIVGLIVVTQGYTSNLQASWNALWTGSSSTNTGTNSTVTIGPPGAGGGFSVPGLSGGGWQGFGVLSGLPPSGENYMPAGLLPA